MSTVASTASMKIRRTGSAEIDSRRSIELLRARGGRRPAGRARRVGRAIRHDAEAGALEHRQRAGEGRVRVDRLAVVGDPDRVRLERRRAARAGVVDRPPRAARAPTPCPRAVDETAKHTIDQTGRSSIVGITRERTMRSKSVRGPRLTQPTARSPSNATRPGGCVRRRLRRAGARAARGTFGAAMSFERSRQNWHQHQRGSPPSRNSAASASQVASVSGSIRIVDRSASHAWPGAVAGIPYFQRRWSITHWSSGTATDMWTWTIRQPAASRWRTALSRISALRAVGEEPGRLVGEPADVAVRVADRVRAGLEPLAGDLGAAAERRLVVDPLAGRADEDQRRVARDQVVGRVRLAGEHPAVQLEHVSRISVDGAIASRHGHRAVLRSQRWSAAARARRRSATASPERLQSEYEPTYRIGSGRPATRIASE